MNENEKTTYKKKLIEVALPLDAINKASAREKSIRHEHPSTLHLWWARRPLAAARAVLFAQLVDDPSSHPELFPTEEEQNRERDRLFALIEELVKWENTNNEKVLEAARNEIRKSWALTCKETGDDPDKLPAFHDPFAGGGSIPLEAQRLGLEAYASDLNPVAVLICKAMIEIPPKFAGQPPVNPESRKKHEGMNIWKGAQGLAEDVRYYGQWMRDEAEKRIGHLYPKVKVTSDIVKMRPDLKQYKGKELTVIAWIWARTVKSSNPAFSHMHVPLVSSFVLSSRKNKEAWLEPIVDNDGFRLHVRTGKFKPDSKTGTKLGRGANFKCIMSGTPLEPAYVKSEGKAGRFSRRLIAIVCEGNGGRVYLDADQAHENVSESAKPNWRPNIPMPKNPRWFSPPDYGLPNFGDIFDNRQLVAINTFSDLIEECRQKARSDAIASGLFDDEDGLKNGGDGATAYGDAMSLFLSFALDKSADYWSSICGWHSSRELIRNTFGRQAIPMVWDYAECNPMCSSSGNWMSMINWIVKVIGKLPSSANSKAMQADAQNQDISRDKIVSTDPPYFDNIGYADLSDYFYVWLRRSLRETFPDLFATMTVPKATELIATPYRHGSRKKANLFFMDGMAKAIQEMALLSNKNFPASIYYAFKQAESESGDTVSTGWEMFLEAVLKSGFSITGTWPMRTELSNRMVGMGTNALASSIVLVCRKKSEDADLTTRRDFQTQLRNGLPNALRYLQKSNIAPVDLAQSAIGPGMSIFSRYNKVIEADGSPMSVRTALVLINEVLDEILTEQEGELDSDSRWAVSWFEQFGTGEGPFGVAETLCKAKNTSIQGLVDAGFLFSKAGRVHLLRRDEMNKNWDPSSDNRLTVWESTQHLIRVLENEGEEAASVILKKLGGVAEQARDLAYRLYMTCERKGWAEEARSYNALVVSWPELKRLASSVSDKRDKQGKMFE